MNFLINTFTHWEEPPRTRHQVAYALARNHRVVFVAANKVGLPRIRSFRTQEGITVVQPWFPAGNKIRYRLPGLNESYQNWLFRWLKNRFPEYRVINFDFTATRIYRFFQDVSFYYNDNHGAISYRINPKFIARYHEKVEAYVASKARFCVSVYPLLQEKLGKFNPRSYIVPLGGPDISGFGIIPKEKSLETRPIKVGLMGFITSYSISTETLNEILDQDSMELVIVGPVEDSIMAKLRNTERLVLRGTLTGADLYREMNDFDVAVSPYNEAITKNNEVGVTTGNKLYQYLALGKPVVISHMEGLKDVKVPDRFLYIAREKTEFPQLIRQAFEENNAEAIDRRVAYAAENTWEKRMDLLLEIYKETD